MLLKEDCSYAVIGAAIQVHQTLGPGLLESAYESCLAIEFQKQGITFERQKTIPIFYDGHLVDCGYRLDFLIEGSLILELKAVEKLLPIHEAQLFTYLRLAGLSSGLLINFNVLRLTQGIVRRVL